MTPSKGVGGSWRSVPPDRAKERSSGRLYVFHDGTVRVTVELSVVAGTWQPVGFDVRAYLGSDRRDVGLTARELRGIQFGRLVDAARAQLRREEAATFATEGPVHWVDTAGHNRISIDAAAAERSLEHLEARRPGRPRLADEELEREAHLFEDIAKTSRQPTKDLAVKLNLSRSAAAKHVHRARERGFLPKARRGGHQP